MRYLVDTNILLRWSDADSSYYRQCVDAVNRLIDKGDQPCACAQVLIEFWVSATRPKQVNGFGMSCLEAKHVLSEIRRVFICLPEPPDLADLWEETVIQHEVLGKQAHDARLAAFMQAHGIKHLVTLNPQDFTRYQDIIPLTPTEILSL